jgi:predicted nuclease of predicted toxin-antitoxin system
MRFLVDERTGPSVARWLEAEGHEVFSVYDEARGSDDKSIMQTAKNESYIIITNDKDFGRLVFKAAISHHGVILLRLENENTDNKIAVLQRVLFSCSGKISGNFIVAADESIRVHKYK